MHQPVRYWKGEMGPRPDHCRFSCWYEEARQSPHATLSGNSNGVQSEDCLGFVQQRLLIHTASAPHIHTAGAPHIHTAGALHIHTAGAPHIRDTTRLPGMGLAQPARVPGCKTVVSTATCVCFQWLMPALRDSAGTSSLHTISPEGVLPQSAGSWQGVTVPARTQGLKAELQTRDSLFFVF